MSAEPALDTTGARSETDIGSPAAVAAQDWPSFSVVIPTYQRREVVCDAVRALCRLDYPGPIELIVVVDGSTDGTAEALATFACPFPVKIIEQQNEGAAAARNRGAAEAANDIILFLDDDMMSRRDLVREHGRLYGDGADAVIGDTPIDPASPAGFLADSVARWIESTRVRTPLSPFDIFSGQLSVRRSVFEQLGGFDSAFTSGPAFGSEDTDFGARLLAACDVRHNGAAVSLQRYVVGPREYLDRAQRAVAAHLQFIRKHPELARDLFERKGFSRPLTRWLYRPLSRIPLLPKLIAELGVGTAEVGLRTRFRSSRLLARLFSGACSLAYWTELRRKNWLPFSNSALVLCYHAIRDQGDDPVLAPYGVGPELFEQQLDSLTRRGFTFITPAQLAAFLEAGAPVPRRPVLLTFDDGYSELTGVARKVLQPRGIEGIAFVVTGPASNEWDQAYGAGPIDLLTREQRDELVRLGIEIGSHSRSHREMPQLDDAEQETEAGGSFEDLATEGQPRFFAYPYGASDGRSRGAVSAAGFLGAFGLRQRRLSRASDRFDLPRVIVLAADRGWRFRAKTAAPRLFNLYARALRKLGVVTR